MFSAQQTRSGIPTEQQSVLPTVRGVPWWGAVLIALVPTVAGAIIDASNTDGLSTTYRILYFIGCVVAVLAVRRRSLFTAISQPPLIAFGVALITLYLLKADSGSGLRQLILNVMLPIAKTFPLMAWTFIAVAVLGVGRALLTRGRTESTPRRSARHHATKATTRTRTRTTAAKGDDAATDAGARTTRRTAARGSAPRSDDAERSRARRIADEPTRVTNRRPGAERASRSDRTPTERGRSTPAPLTGHRRTDVAPTPASRWDAPAPRRSAAEDAAARRRDDEAARRRPPPRGERDLAVPRSEREVPPRSDGTGRRRPPPSREEAPRPGDLPPIPRARYRGVNP
ncbi:hypothetical protein ASG12_14285 [Williamsia sp. Leaf354]|uniref:DUF6542 domain-containing protein n=1 Tax=Williamsia sp. Leaf354 TaxID=1736349 RepID=UPI0006F898A0|nr:DUF6542 domain-containing protein [Williamsia sp. Leaf354]KQR98120.1 hypothetical protein ASG12_14285 [Williamsia sp. Leaf354]